METEKTFKYYAFISYKREDEEWAKWLQHKLEHYKLPSNLNGRTDLPKEIRPIFKDTSELNPGNLPQQIHDALEQSKFLIVICSPRSAQSEWVNKEVETFIEMGKTDKIIPFIIDGKAFAKNPKEECFPKAITNLPSEQEILGANIGEMGRDAAAVKVIAQMFGLKFDDLWQRYERDQRKKRNWIIAASISGFLFMAGVAFWMYAQRQETLKANWKMMENQARFVAEKAISIAAEDSYLAKLLAIEVLPDDLNHPNRPCTIEAEIALRKAVSFNTAYLKGHTDIVWSANFTPDGKQIISTSEDNTVRFWDAYSGKEIKSITPPFHYYHAFISPDGKLIAFIDDYYNESNIYVVHIYDATNGKELLVLPNNPEEWNKIHIVGFSLDNQKIIIASDENNIIWDIDSGKELCRLENAPSNIYSVAFSRDGKRIITGDTDNNIKIWDAESGKKLMTLKGHTGFVDEVFYSPDETRIYSQGRDSTIRIWDVVSGKEKKCINSHNEITATTLSPNGKHIASAYGGYIHFLNAKTGEETRKPQPINSRIHSISFCPDGKRILSANGNHTIHIMDFEAIEEEGKQTIQSRTVSERSRITSRDSTIIAYTVSYDIHVVDSKSNKELLFFEHLGAPVLSLDISPDNTTVIAALWDGTIRLWDIAKRDTIMCIKPQNDYGFSNFVAFSPNGKHFLSISNHVTTTISIWDARTGDEIRVINGHDDYIYSATFSPDSKYIASISRDKTVRVWDSKTSLEIKKFDIDFPKYGEYGEHFVSFSSDGKYIIATKDDNTIVTYDSPPLQELIDQTRERFKDRPLTPEERNMYYLE